MELATAAAAAVASPARPYNHFSSPRAVSVSWNNSWLASSSSSRSLSTSSASTSRRRLPVASAAVELREAAAGGGESVRVTGTPQPGSSVKFSVEVPTSIIQECYQSTLQEYAKRFKVPGFRPGKMVPENLLINYVGPEYVQDATIEAFMTSNGNLCYTWANYPIRQGGAAAPATWKRKYTPSPRSHGVKILTLVVAARAHVSCKVRTSAARREEGGRDGGALSPVSRRGGVAHNVM